MAFPFSDDWGIVIEGGLSLNPEPGFVGGLFNFTNPINAIQVDVGIQLTKSDNIWVRLFWDDVQVKFM